MARCLECGFSYPAWDKNQAKEFSQAERDKLEFMISPLLIPLGVDRGGLWKGDLGPPFGLGCFRGARDFPGEPSTIDISAAEMLPVEDYVNQTRSILDALEHEWDCPLFVSHIPGLTPPEHLSLNEYREWRSQQENARRAWEEEQDEKGELVSGVKNGEDPKRQEGQ